MNRILSALAGLLFATAAVAQGVPIGPAGGSGGSGSSPATPTYVLPANPATINAPVRATVSTTAAQMPSQTFVNGPVIQANATNTGLVCLGNANTVTVANGYCLTAGQPISYGVTQLSAVWYIGQNSSDGLQVTGN